MTYTADAIALQRLLIAAGQLSLEQLEALAAAAEQQVAVPAPACKARRKHRPVLSVVTGGLGFSNQTLDSGGL